jgi:hypothetical protein
MRAYSSYVSNLDRLVREVANKTRAERDPGRIDAALDGGAARALRELVGIEERRSSGAFFTSSPMAECVLAPLVPTINDQSIVVDPACGAGDLLLYLALALPKFGGLAETLALWGRVFHGRDVHPEFVRAARRRLVLAALQAGPGELPAPLDLRGLFTNVRTGCGLTVDRPLLSATHVVLNPPFTRGAPRTDVPWSSGRISNAALFIDCYVGRMRPGTRIVAILPDVLRSGTQARRWRESVEARCDVLRVEKLGQFSEWADIDVFVLDLVVGLSGPMARADWDRPCRSHSRTVGDYFHVSVGRVVPFRDANAGKQYRYVYPKTLTAWGVDSKATARRRFMGKVTPTPFVAVRRTSRPGHKHRAVGTIVVGAGPVAVENHLLVLRPIDGTLDACERLIEVLRSPKSDEWIDRKIRCRHLTAASLEHLPWWPEVE